MVKYSVGSPTTFEVLLAYEFQKSSTSATDSHLYNTSNSSTLSWKIPWMEKPGRLQSMGSLGVGHDWVTSLSLFTFMHWRRTWQPTPVFLPGESQGQEAWWAAAYGVAQSQTQLKRLSSSSSSNHLISLSPGSFSFALQRAGGRSLAHLYVCECAACALQRTLCSF